MVWCLKDRNKASSWIKAHKRKKKNGNILVERACGWVSAVVCDIQCANMLLSLGDRNSDRLILIYGFDFVRIENPYERRRPTIRSTQINPFSNDIAFSVFLCFFFSCCFCFGRPFIHSFDRNNATIYLFPFKSSVLQPNKNDSYRFGQKGNRSCHDKKVLRFVSLIRTFILIFHLARMFFFFSFRELSPHTESEMKKRRVKFHKALNECAMSGLYSQSKKRRFKSGWNEMKME